MTHHEWCCSAPPPQVGPRTPPRGPNPSARSGGVHAHPPDRGREVLAGHGDRNAAPMNAAFAGRGLKMRYRGRFADLRDGKRPATPGRLVEVQAAALQIVAIPIVRGVTEQVVQPPAAVAKVWKRQPHVALALVGRIVHRHQQPLATGTLPGKSHEAIPGPVAVPGGCAVEQLPVAVAHGRLAQHGQQPVVELLQPLVDRLPPDLAPDAERSVSCGPRIVPGGRNAARATGT